MLNYGRWAEKADKGGVLHATLMGSFGLNLALNISDYQG